MIISTHGDLGDVCVNLGVLHRIPNGPHTILFERDQGTKWKTEADVDHALSLLKPLAESQPYIAECRKINPGEHVDWVSSEFRKSGYQGYTLMRAQVNNLVKTHGIGREIDGSHQWLSCKVSPKSKDRIVINRSGRWRNSYFPWKSIVKHYHWRLMFIGLQHEYREFCSHFGYVDYEPTPTMLDVAELIAGSLMFIGNQSACNSIAEGLKHRMIQETCQSTPDCVYPRGNAQHIVDGEVHLPGFDGDPDLFVPCTFPDICYNVQLHAVPPNGGWRYPGYGAHPIFKVLFDRVVLNEPTMSKDEITKRIIKETTDACPGFFPPGERSEIRRQMDMVVSNSRGS